MTTPYSTTQYIPAINTDEDTRSSFMVRVYQHIGIAVAAFIGIEIVLFGLGINDFLLNLISGTRGNLVWLALILGASFGGAALQRLTYPGAPVSTQYAGLFGYAGIEALLFAPILTIAYRTNQGNDIWQAAVVTALAFAALTTVGITTSKDLSFLKPALMFIGIVAFIAIGISLVFNVALGTWFSLAMVAFMGLIILYQSQKIVRTYPVNAHVAAAASLFGAVMTMFFYILRIFLSRD